MKKITNDPGVLHFTPGVKLEAGQDALGQRYRTLEDVLVKDECDIVIVGRGITKSEDPIKTAQAYKEKAWELFANRYSRV